MRRVGQPPLDREPPAALRHQPDEALLGPELGDLGQRAHPEPLLPAAHLAAALDQHHPELRRVGLEQLGQHHQVALLEHPQPQRHVGEQHRAEREHRQGGHGVQPLPPAIASARDTGRRLLPPLRCQRDCRPLRAGRAGPGLAAGGPTDQHRATCWRPGRCSRTRRPASAARCCAGRAAWSSWRTGTGSAAASRSAPGCCYEGRPVVLKAPAPARAAGAHPDGVGLGPRTRRAGQDRPGQPDLRRGPARRRAGREDLGRRPAARRRGGRVPRRHRRPAGHRRRLRPGARASARRAGRPPGARAARSRGSPTRSGAASGGEYVLVLGHPYVDIWQAVKPGRLGLAAWPQIPRGTDWKHGICAALGWPHRDQADIAAAWQVILGRVESWDDLERPLLTTVEQLFDFVTQDHQLQTDPSGSVQQVADHAVGQQPAPAASASAARRRPRPDPGRPGRAPAVASVAVSTSSGSPSASRSSSSTRSVRRSSAVSTSRAYAGERSAASRSAYAARVLDVPPAHPADVAVRARPDPPPVVPAPVGQVVPAAGGRPGGPVAHLVRGVARRRSAAPRRPGTCRPGRRRRASAARRGGPGPPAGCRPRRSGRTR